MNGCCYVSDLEGGDLRGTIKIMELVRRIKTRRPTFFVIDESNPRKEHLMQAYERRLPARKAFTFWEVQ